MAMRSSYIGIPWLSLAEMATSSLHDRGPLPSSSDLILLVFPSHGGDSITGLPGPGNYNYTIGPGTVGMLLRTLSTVSIHESGQGLKEGLAEIEPIGNLITERGSCWRVRCLRSWRRMGSGIVRRTRIRALSGRRGGGRVRVCLICDIVDAFLSRGQWEDYWVARRYP